MALNLLRTKDKGLAVCNGEIPQEELACYHVYHICNTSKKDERNSGEEELMTALTKQQDDSTQRLQSKYEGDSNPKPVSPVFLFVVGRWLLFLGWNMLLN